MGDKTTIIPRLVHKTWHLPKPIVVFFILSIIVNLGLTLYLLLRPINQLQDVDSRSYTRLSSIYWLVDTYGEKRLSRYAKLEIAKSFLALPDDNLGLMTIAINAYESQYIKTAVSKKDAVGIAQFLVSTALPYLREMGYNPRTVPEAVKLLKEPQISARACYNHISDLHIVYKDDYRAVLFAYNHDKAYVDTVYNLTKTIFAQYDSVYLIKATEIQTIKEERDGKSRQGGNKVLTPRPSLR